MIKHNILIIDDENAVLLVIKEAYVDGRDKVSQKWSFKNEPPG